MLQYAVTTTAKKTTNVRELKSIWKVQVTNDECEKVEANVKCRIANVYYVAQVSKPAVSPTSSRQGVNESQRLWIRNPRHSRLGSLRYRFDPRIFAMMRQINGLSIATRM